jgi:hypothetical protein
MRGGVRFASRSHTRKQARLGHTPTLTQEGMDARVLGAGAGSTIGGHEIAGIGHRVHRVVVRGAPDLPCPNRGNGTGSQRFAASLFLVCLIRELESFGKAAVL